MAWNTWFLPKLYYKTFFLPITIVTAAVLFCSYVVIRRPSNSSASVALKHSEDISNKTRVIWDLGVRNIRHPLL